MRIMLLTILGLLPALATPAAPGVSPYLKLLERSPHLLRARTQLPPGLSLPAGALRKRAQIGLLVETRDPDGLRRTVAAMGGRAGRALGDIVPLRLPLERLDELASLPGVMRIEGGPPRRLLLDLSRADAGADVVERGDKPLAPLDGTGVLVALVDTGVDYDHPDLCNDTSRVLRIWDQFAASGQPPPGQTVGVLCDRGSILKGSCDSIDIIGHGTHVTSTMASSGTKYRGMAPGADIMAVASMDFSLLVESVAWLFDQADEMHRPMVVNLSLGGHYGPHDGSSLESQSLSQLDGPGHIIVAAAGNEGLDYIHLGYDPGGQEGRTRFDVYTGFDVSTALIDIWHAASADLEFAVMVRRAGQVVATSDFISAGDQPASFELDDGGTALGSITFEPAGTPDAGNGKLQLDILVEPSDDAFADNPAGYEWLLAVRGNGYFDAWSAASGLLTPPARFSDSSAGGLIPGDNSRSVGMPAVAPGIVAVASYATRASWTDADGNQVSHGETSPGRISFFSSRGPSADADATGPKPLLAAPGEYIVAARSHNAGELEQGTTIDAEHVAMRGTSMACPHVAGVVALLLQADPQLDPAGVERILRLSARRDEHTGSGDWDERYGYGKLDARQAAAMAEGVGICESDDDCRVDLTCQQGRCREQAGCGCTSAAHPESHMWLALLLVGLLRRRRNRGTGGPGFSGR